MGCVIESGNQIRPQKPVKVNLVQNTRKQKEEYVESRDFGNCQNVFKIQIEMTKSDKLMLNKALSAHFLLYRLAPTERTQIINCFDTYECPPRTIIFKKQQKPTLLFLIKQGKVQVKRNDRTAETSPIILERGSFFGDLALIYNSPRSATIQSVTYCQFFCLQSTLFRKIIKQIIKRNYQISKKFIENIAIFTYLSKRQKSIVASNTLLLKFEKNKVIFYEGDDANSIYIIVTGKVEINIPGKPPLFMGTGQSFGQNCFQGNSVRSGSATAVEEASLLSIGRDSLKECLGKHLRQISFINILKWSFSRNQLLMKIPIIQRDKLIALTDTKQYKNKQTICQQGDIADSIIIVLEQKINGNEIGTICNTKYIPCLTQNDLRIDKRLVKNGKGCVGILTFQNIRKVLGENLKALIKNITQLDLKLNRIQQIKILQLCDIFVLNKIWQSKSSQIYLINDKFKRKYALKMVNKIALIDQKYAQSLRIQQRVMSIEQIPYSIKFHKLFQDDKNLYYITNYIDGFRLSEIRKKVGPFSRQKAKMMISSLLLAIQQLHANDFVHRDLQPEKILIDQSGYLHIVDFSVSKQLKHETNYRTFTLVGTPHYMAPQIISNKGYSFAVDYWSIGIIMYEILFGCLPFTNQNSDPYQILRQIDSNDLQFPNVQIQKSAKQMIQSLLCKNPIKRVEGGITQLKNSNFFWNINWSNIEQSQQKINLKMKMNGIGEQINQPFIKFIKRNNLANEKQLRIKFEVQK